MKCKHKTFHRLPSIAHCSQNWMSRHQESVISHHLFLLILSSHSFFYTQCHGAHTKGEDLSRVVFIGVIQIVVSQAKVQNP